MDALERLQAEVDQDFALARARQDALHEVNTAIAALKARGFSPRIDVTEGGLVRLEFDPEHIELPEIKQLPAPAKTRAEAPTAERSPEPAPTETGPRPDPEPQPAPAAKEAPTTTETVTGPYSDEELATLRRMVADGCDRDEIAKTLSRDKRGVALAIKRVKAEAEEPAARPAREPEADRSEPPAPERAPASEPKVTAPPPADQAPPFDPSAPYPERQCRLRLKAVGWPSPWSPALDLVLTQALARGDGISAAAEACGVDKANALKRWKAINPDPTLESQTLLLKVLPTLDTPEGDRP